MISDQVPAPLRHHWLVVGMVALIALPLGLLSGFPPPCEVQANLQAPANDSIVTGPVDPIIAARNRAWLESKTGLIALPPGQIWFDQAPALNDGTTLEGPGTILSQKYTGGGYPLNAVLRGEGSGFGHVHPFTRLGPTQISSGSAVDCPVGTLIYCWKNDGYRAGGSQPQRRIVTARVGNTLTLDQPVAERSDVLKWLKDATPIADPVEGAQSVYVTRGQWPPGMLAIVTDGPSIANEANGELRRIVSVTGNQVTLDRPLRRSYSQAAIARVQPSNRVTLRGLTIDYPVNAASESLYATKATNWLIERCTIRRLALGNCADFEFRDCDIGWVQAAASSHDLRFRDCQIQSITFEEGCHDLTVEDCRLGPVGSNMNCLSLRAKSERLTLRNSLLLGGAWPSSQILMDSPGRECVFESLRMAGRHSPCWLSGDRMRLTGIMAEGDITVTGADITRSQVWAANMKVWP